MELVDLIIKAAQDKKAFNLIKIDVKDLTVVAEDFVICSARSSTQVKAIADSIEEKLEKEGTLPLRKDGFTSGNWIVMDYGHVLVHIFTEETRKFYSIERLWANENNVTEYKDEE